jgi:hypothetical protein
MAIFFQTLPVKTDYKSLAELITFVQQNPTDDDLGEAIDVWQKGRVVYVKYKREGVVSTVKYWDRKKEPAPRKRAVKTNAV